MTIAALYVQPEGAYYGAPGVDPWDEARDARTYAGPHPVVAHPPCQRWGAMASVNFARWGGEHNRPGNDLGCFRAARRTDVRWCSRAPRQEPRVRLPWPHVATRDRLARVPHGRMGLRGLAVGLRASCQQGHVALLLRSRQADGSAVGAAGGHAPGRLPRSAGQSSKQAHAATSRGKRYPDRVPRCPIGAGALCRCLTPSHPGQPALSNTEPINTREQHEDAMESISKRCSPGSQSAACA